MHEKKRGAITPKKKECRVSPRNNANRGVTKTEKRVTEALRFILYLVLTIISKYITPTK